MDLVLLAKRSTAAGRWTAQVAAFFDKHPEQSIEFGAMNGRPYLVVAPKHPSGAQLSAHGHMAHGDCLNADAVGTFLSLPHGGVVMHINGRQSFYGTVGVEQGRQDFAEYNGAGWLEMAQTIALVACATADVDPVHQAFLYGLIGPGSGSGTIHNASVGDQVHKAAHAISARKPVGRSRLAMPEIPAGYTESSLAATLVLMAATAMESASAGYTAHP